MLSLKRKVIVQPHFCIQNALYEIVYSLCMSVSEHEQKVWKERHKIITSGYSCGVGLGLSKGRSENFHFF